MSKKDQNNIDQKLIAKAQKNSDAFGKLYEKYFDDIFYFVFSRVRSEDLAGDITQNTMLKAMANIKKYKWTGAPFKAWLVRIAINEVNLYYRKNKKEVVIEVNENQLQSFYNEVVTTSAMSIGQQELIIKLLQSLDAKDQELIELKYFNQLTNIEIAAYYNIGLSACKMRISRTLKKIEDIWKLEYEKI